MALSSANWFRPEMPVYSVGLLIYIVLVVLFAYFYTSITFNPLEVANNMKKSGGFIDSSSAMAAMVEVFKDQVAHIDSIELQGIKSLPVSL